MSFWLLKVPRPFPACRHFSCPTPVLKWLSEVEGLAVETISSNKEVCLRLKTVGKKTDREANQAETIRR